MNANSFRIVKLLGAAAIVSGALLIMFPDILKLIVGFGRIAAYICTIVGVAFCVTLIYNHLQRLRLSGQTKSASGKTEIESAINEKSDAKEHTE